MNIPPNQLVRSSNQIDLLHSNEPKSPDSPLDEVVITTYTYNIPNSVLREQEKRKCCDEKMKSLCKCIIL